mmetsp:Transcript_39748/g.78591  ORF Transcript_39748/g.78591 Transcript_39748/m.78591 type:complete len:440 (-) Transcript_39748:264-1583(-)
MATNAICPDVPGDDSGNGTNESCTLLGCDASTAAPIALAENASSRAARLSVMGGSGSLLLLLPLLVMWASSGQARLPLIGEERHIRLQGAAAIPPPRSAIQHGCTTAANDSTCGFHVRWAMQQGIIAEPDWYPGLSKDSSFEAFQALLHERGQHHCPKPCHAEVMQMMKAAPSKTTHTTDPPKRCGNDGRATIASRVSCFFCFSAMIPNSSEEALIKAQLDMQTSIFACESWAVVSSDHRWLGQHNGQDVFTTVVRHPMTCRKGHYGVGGAKTNGYLNSGFFMAVWNLLIDEGRPWGFDYTAKVDPDAVFFPDRLSGHVDKYKSKAVYLLNCNKWSSPKLYGSLEVFSEKALQKFSAGREQCKGKLKWQVWGEDQFMQECMALLQVQGQGDFVLVGDANCGGGSCSDQYRVAFHGFKTVDGYKNCVAWAGYNTGKNPYK